MVSCIRSRSGLCSSRNSSTRGSRALSELTFQVAIFVIGVLCTLEGVGCRPMVRAVPFIVMIAWLAALSLIHI